MTAKEILELNLSESKKQTFRNWCDVMERLRKSTDVEAITNKTTADRWIDDLIARKAKQAEAKARKEQRFKEQREKEQQIKDLFIYAKEVGYSQQDVIDIVMNAIKEKHNARIEEQIARLKEQLM